MSRPNVIISACTEQVGAYAYHMAQMKYVDAIVRGAACMPLLLPALGHEMDLEGVLAVADGVMLTGSASNVHPSHYAQPVRDPNLPQDRARDATTLPLIRAVLKRGIPLLAICRGFQEVNVALGGSLHQALHEVAGMMDHRDPPHQSQEEQYAPAHRIALVAGGRLAHMLDGVSELYVNSLHGQGLDDLAPGLEVEARAADGLVEAYCITSAPGFTLAIQWHPEWRLAENPASMKLFRAFGDACRDYQSKRCAGA